MSTSIQDLEREKIELEIAALKAPWFVKPANLIALLSLGFAGYQYVSSQSTLHDAEELVTKTAETRDFLDSKVAVLRSREQELQGKENVTAAPPISPAQELAVSELPADKIMDVWAYRVDLNLVREVKTQLREAGNEVGFGTLLPIRPDWLSLNSAVFYYSNASRRQAEVIADELGRQTGIDFEVRRGAGLGVKDSEKGDTFFVHIIGE